MEAPEVQVRLHGRDELIEHVVDSVDPQRTSGASVLLEGDAGVGKTALIEAVAAAVRRRRRVLVGHCVGEVAGTLSYLPFVEAFGKLDATDPTAVDALVEGYPSVAALLPRRAATEGDEGDWSRIVEAVHGGLELLASRQPILLVVEDIHWADESTRELLTLLFTRGFAGPVSVLASYRSDDLHRRHPLRSSLAVWSRLKVGRVEVPPLEEPAMRSLVQAVDDRLDHDTVTDIVDRAGGNAFFAEEMVAAVGTGTSDDLGRLLLRRLDALGEDAQDVVRRAAVVGRRVGHHLLLASTGIDAAHLDRLLREIVDHHILEPTRDGGYIFRHALLAEAVYDDLLPGEIVRHHCACADALRRQPELGTHADLARHAIAAHDTDLAIDSSEAAGRAAGRMGGPAEALRHFENALSLMADDDERVHRLTMEAAAAAIASGRVAVALSRLRAGLRRRDATPRERAELLARLAGALHFSDESTDRVAIVDEALALLPPTEDGEDDLRVDLLTRRIEALWHVGRAEEVLVHAEEIGRRGLLDGRRHLRTEIDAIVAKVRSHETDGGASLAAIGKVVAEWGEEVDTALLRARYTLGQILFRQGAVREALEAHLLTVDLAERAGLQASPYAASARALAILCAYEVGDWDLAVDLAAHDGELSEESAASLDAALSFVLAGRGDPRAIEIFRCLQSQWEFDRSTVVQSGVAALDAHGWAGDLAQARAHRSDVVAHLRRIEEQAQVMVEVRLDALLLGHLATRAHRAGADERAALLDEGTNLLGEALSVWDSEPGLPPKTTEAQAWESRARVEHAHLRWRAGEAVDLESLVGEFTTCAGLFASKGDRYEEARCRSRLALVLTAAGRGDEADRERDAAIETARALRAAPLAAELGSTVEGVPGGSTAGSPVPSPSHPDHPEPPRGVVVQLTPREHEVLTLVARGRSNGQVGRELFISTKTVSVHVSNILAKLGASGRGEAVALARDLGLLE